MAARFASSLRTDVGDVTFTGVLDDATIAGPCTAGDDEYDVEIEIDAAAATDTFKVSYDGGGSWPITGEAITGTPQTLGDTGLTVTFAATTGHSLADKWAFPTTSQNGPILLEVTNTDTGYLT